MKRLIVGTDATLPVVMLTDSTTVFGRKRSGKSNNAVVIVEEALDLKAQVIVFDPKGDWWGLASSFDGKKPGYPVVIIGGLHATPKVGALNPYAGATVADWILNTGHSVILDLSQLKDPDRERFCGPFLETIRRRKSAEPGPLLLVIDEADELAPQDERERAHVMDTYRGVVWMVKRGGFAGIGTLIITQRPASLSKNITTQSETIITLQVGGSQDLDAVAAALKHHVDGDTPKARATALDDLLREIVRLEKGGTIIVSASAGLRGQIHRIQFRRRKTFDSGATPEFGQKVRAPKVVAHVDLEALTEAMEKAQAEVEANDPKKIRAEMAEKIRTLEAAIKMKDGRSHEVKVPALTASDRKALAKVPDEIDRAAANLYRVLEGIDLGVPLAAAGEVARNLRAILTAPTTDPILRRGPQGPAAGATVPVAPPAKPSTRGPGSDGQQRSTRPASPDAAAAGGITGAQQKVLDALAWFASVGVEEVSRVAVAGLAGIRPTSGNYSVNLRVLKDRQLIAYPKPGTLHLTDRGAAWTAPPAVALTPDDLHAAIFGKLPAAKVAILRTLIGCYPRAMTREELARTVGVSQTSGSYSVNVGDLRDYGFVTYPSPGQVMAAPLLFLEAA